MVKSLSKGKRFERQVAAILTAATGVKWHRVPQSGATATNYDLHNLRGDVFTEDERFANFVIECKNHKGGVSLYHLFNPKSPFQKWLSQTRKEADGRNFMLFFKDNRKIFVGMPRIVFHIHSKWIRRFVDTSRMVELKDSNNLHEPGLLIFMVLPSSSSGAENKSYNPSKEVAK